ncbi:MAG: J domain-containing protein [Nitrospirae bacterium]|nr:J domain-containing protein [Nitrospirota bacterium]
MKDMDLNFDALGLKPDASWNDVQEAYLQVMEIWNPALFTWDPEYQQEAAKKRRECKAAYEALTRHFIKSAGEAGQGPAGEEIVPGVPPSSETGPSEKAEPPGLPLESLPNISDAGEKTGVESGQGLTPIPYKALTAWFGLLGFGLGYSLLHGLRGALMGVLLGAMGGGAGALMAYYFSIMNTPRNTKNAVVGAGSLVMVLFIGTGAVAPVSPGTGGDRENSVFTFIPDKNGLSAERDSRWLYLSESPYFSLYYDQKSITRLEGDVARVWVSGEPIPGKWQDYLEQRRSNNLPISGFDQLSSVLMLNEIRCSTREIRVTAVHELDLRKRISNSRKMPEAAWEPVLPESKGESLMKVSCP